MSRRSGSNVTVIRRHGPKRRAVDFMLKRETPFLLAFSALLVLSPAWAGDVAVSPDGRNKIEYADGENSSLLSSRSNHVKGLI